ncbi:RNA polymerase sigma factor [Paenibacillus sp.]|uniref:RNA polymerase sigma factor n=1 Tax=Paenibacillus sp. TaxID=58172 RepID=UPI0028128645|nr:RNA polymerase sigma factor [Paenibacillus sp.]
MMHALGAKETSSTGAAAAFDRAAAPLLPSLQAYCRSVARNRWDADDLMQDTLEKAFARFARTGGAPLTKAYLYRIASNAWIDRLRRARESVQPAEWAGWEAPARAASAEDARADEALDAAARRLASLTPKQRTALLLSEAFALPLQETADRLGMTVGSVKSLLHRARARLGRASDAEAPPSASDAAAVDAYIAALRRGSIDAVVALGASAEAGAGPSASARLDAGRFARSRARAARTGRRSAIAGGRVVGFAATSDGACAAVARPGDAAVRVLSFRAGDAIAV